MVPDRKPASVYLLPAHYGPCFHCRQDIQNGMAKAWLV